MSNSKELKKEKNKKIQVNICFKKKHDIYFYQILKLLIFIPLKKGKQTKIQVKIFLKLKHDIYFYQILKLVIFIPFLYWSYSIQDRYFLKENLFNLGPFMSYI